MAIQQVREYFEQFGIAQRILEFPESSATVELAAHAVGAEPARIAKTLSFLVKGEPMLIVTAGDAKIDNRRYKDFFHVKAAMLSPEQVIDCIGHAIGGVCPFALKNGVSVYLDESLRRFTTVYPACGSSNSAIELTLPELETLSHYKEWIDVCKGWREEEQS